MENQEKEVKNFQRMLDKSYDWALNEFLKMSQSDSRYAWWREDMMKYKFEFARIEKKLRIIYVNVKYKRHYKNEDVFRYRLYTHYMEQVINEMFKGYHHIHTNNINELDNLNQETFE
jgi:hypothetical protein